MVTISTVEAVKIVGSASASGGADLVSSPSGSSTFYTVPGGQSFSGTFGVTMTGSPGVSGHGTIVLFVGPTPVLTLNYAGSLVGGSVSIPSLGGGLQLSVAWSVVDASAPVLGLTFGASGTLYANNTEVSY